MISNFFFFFRIPSIVTHTQGEIGESFKETNNGVVTHTQGEMRESFKETNSGVYPKGLSSNSDKKKKSLLTYAKSIQLD